MDARELIDGLNELADASFAACPFCGRSVAVADGVFLNHSVGTGRCPGSGTAPPDRPKDKKGKE